MNLIIPKLLVQPPSGKTKKGAYLPVSAINFYLYSIISTDLDFPSPESSLGMKIQSTDLQIFPIKKIFFIGLLGAKAGLNILIIVKISIGPIWLQTIVEVYLSSF